MFYYDIVRGIDERPVEPVRERKSWGREITLDEDILDMDLVRSILADIAVELEEGISGKSIKGRTITLKIKYHDFQQITRSVTIDEPTNSGGVIIDEIFRLLQLTEAGTKKIRLLGISLSHLQRGTGAFQEKQLLLPFMECL